MSMPISGVSAQRPYNALSGQPAFGLNARKASANDDQFEAPQGNMPGYAFVALAALGTALMASKLDVTKLTQMTKIGYRYARRFINNLYKQAVTFFSSPEVKAGLEKAKTGISTVHNKVGETVEQAMAMFEKESTGASLH